MIRKETNNLKSYTHSCLHVTFTFFLTLFIKFSIKTSLEQGDLMKENTRMSFGEGGTCRPF